MKIMLETKLLFDHGEKAGWDVLYSTSTFCSYQLFINYFGKPDETVTFLYT